jgi:hypothetical protein
LHVDLPECSAACYPSGVAVVSTEKPNHAECAHGIGIDLYLYHLFGIRCNGKPLARGAFVHHQDPCAPCVYEEWTESPFTTAFILFGPTHTIERLLHQPPLFSVGLTFCSVGLTYRHTVVAAPLSHSLPSFALRKAFSEYVLTQVQADALASVMDAWFPQDESTLSFQRNKRALVQMPCGTGKTHFSLTVASELRDRKLIDSVVILVPTKVIADMWASQFDSPQGVTILTYQSLCRRNPTLDKLAQAAPYYHRGPNDRILVIVDEVHHVAAPTFFFPMTSIMPADTVKFVLGLTGTLERKDGLHSLVSAVFHDCIPYVRTAIEEKRTLGALDVWELEYSLQWDEAQRLAEHNLPSGRLALTHALSQSRAAFVIERLLPLKFIKENRKHILYLCVRIEQLTLLLETLNRQSDDAISYSVDLKTSKAALTKFPRLKEAYEAVRKKKSKGDADRKLTLGSMLFCGEGFNDPTIDCLVFGDKSPNMMQNGNRLRGPADKEIVYLASTNMQGGKQAMSADLQAITKELYTSITVRNTMRVDLDALTDETFEELLSGR